VARKTFTINTEPHVADVGGTELLFQPEVMGDQFLDHYEQLRDAQAALGVDVGDLSKVEPARLREVVGALRTFLARMMMPESAARFARYEVTAAGKKLGVFVDPAEAAELAGRRKGGKVEDKSMPLPDRVLVELLEWVVELYGGGGTRPTGSSNGSAPASPSPGTPGKGGLSSRASIRAPGR
jgi:hypothetical protein